MRSPAMKQLMRFSAMVAVLMFLAVTAQSQSRTRSSTRSPNRSQWQQSQGTQSQMEQPDFVRRMQERNARQMQEIQQDIEQMQRWAEENKNRAIQQTVRATEEQWRRIKPRLERIERLKAEADVAVGAGSSGVSSNFSSGNFQGQGFMFGGAFGGGAGAASSSGPVDILDSNSPAGAQPDGWGGGWSTGTKSRLEMTEGEVLCEEIQHLLQGQSVPQAQITEKVAALRAVRARAREDLAKARTELRAMIAPHQEPGLIAMGYLD